MQTQITHNSLDQSSEARMLANRLGKVNSELRIFAALANRYPFAMDIRAVRKENFEFLIKEAGTIAKLARATGANETYLRQIRGGFSGDKDRSPRQVGDALARKLEAGMGKPYGWMDTAHDNAAQNDPSPLLNPRHQALLQLFESVTESDQQEVLRLLSEKKERRDEVIADWLKKQSKKSAA